MKHLETLKGLFKDRQLILMYASFIYGGICLSLFFQNLFTAVAFRVHDFPPQNFGRNATNASENLNESQIVRNMRVPPLMPLEQMVYLFGGVFALANGIHLHRLMDRNKEVKAKYSVMEKLLSEKERIVVKIIKEGGGEELQSEITRKARLSRLKVHRIISRLEKKGIVEKHPFGITNKIFLK